jgi:phosphoribosyl-ATP pyrophosphohydrolase
MEDAEVRNIKRNAFSERADVMYHLLVDSILFKDLLKLPNCHVALAGQHASLGARGHTIKLGSGETDHC